MTYGTLKLRMTKQFPGLDPDVLEGFISDRHSEILQELPWVRLNAMAVLQTTAPYSTGTVALTLGSASVTLTGGTWITGMTGRAFRVTSRDEFYEFTYVSASTATLDRVYEGPTAAAAGYKIFQHVYPMPANCRILADDAFSTTGIGPLSRLSRGQLNLGAPTRAEYGTPQIWSSYMDDSSTPPRMQVELYPIPDTAVGIPFEYTAEASVPATSGASFLPWMEPASALVEGVIAKIKAHLKDYTGAQLHGMMAEKALERMRMNEAARMGPAQLTLDPFYSSYRTKRWTR